MKLLLAKLKALSKRSYVSDHSTTMLTMITLMVLGWVTDALNGTVMFEQWRDAEFSFDLWYVGSTTASFVLLYWLLLLAVRRLREPVVQEMQRPSIALPHKILMGMLSPDSTEILKKIESLLLSEDDLTDLSPKNVEALIQQIGKEWRGEVWLRSLAHHQHSVQAISFIVTLENEATANLTARLMKRLKPSLTVHIHSISEKQAFDIFFLYEEFQRIEKMYCEQGYSEQDMMIDVTPGYKTISIAAAFVVLHNQVSLQYMGKNNQFSEFKMMAKQSVRTS